MPKKVFIFGSYLLSSYEPETTAYLTALGIVDDSALYFSGAQQKTGSSLWGYVDTLVRGIKTELGLSLGSMTLKNAFPLFNPLMGTTSTMQSYNLADSSTFQATFYGGHTFGADGLLPNGTNSYFRCGFNGTDMGTGKTTGGAWVNGKTNILNSGRFYFGAVYTAQSGTQQWALGNNTGGFRPNTFDVEFNNTSQYNPSIADSYGVICMQQISSTQYAVYKRGTQMGTNQTAMYDHQALEIYMGARYNHNTSTIANYNTSKMTLYAFSKIAMTSTNIQNITTLINSFDTSLGR